MSRYPAPFTPPEVRPSDSVGLTVVGHTLPDGLVVVPLAGVAPSCLVVAWAADNRSPLVRSFVLTAAAA